MRQIEPGERNRILAWDTFGIDWQSLGYTLKMDATDPDGVTRTSSVAASSTYPNGGQIIGTSSIFPKRGVYKCIVYTVNLEYISGLFRIPVGMD